MTRTAFRTGPARYEQIVGRIPSYEMGRPAKFAGAVGWLMSGGADFVNGIALRIDDGYAVAT